MACRFPKDHWRHAYTRVHITPDGVTDSRNAKGAAIQMAIPRNSKASSKDEEAVVQKRTFLLEDTAAKSDAFAEPGDTGPHQRVADAIAQLVASEPGGRVIGLEGGWGAGKSSIVDYLSQRLESGIDFPEDDFTVFVFDAWAHEGDPLRRTYLETLTRHLQALVWVEPATWDEELKVITNRKKETDTETKRSPSLFGAAFGASILGVPFGCGLMAVQKGVTFDLNLAPNGMFILGAFFALAPFIALILRVPYLRWKKESILDMSNWSFLQDHGKVVEKTTTIQSPNPTSVEFEDYFRRLIEAALDTHPKRRILLVLDNLDRVDPQAALEI